MIEQSGNFVVAELKIKGGRFSISQLLDHEITQLE